MKPRVGFAKFSRITLLGAVVLVPTLSRGANGITDEAQVPAYALPDPLTCADGTKVADAMTWNEKRRPELLRLFEREVYGRTLVGRPDAWRFVVREEKKDARGGKATRLRIGVLFEGREDGRQMELLVFLPNDVTRPSPVLLGLNFDGNYTITDDPDLPVPRHWAMGLFANKLQNNTPAESGRGAHKYMWQVDLAIESGYGIATAAYGEIEPDAEGRWRDGPRGLAHEPGDGDWGSIGAWAWGLCRAMDYLETNPRVDAKRVTVMGFSRLGKAAMWAGAQDQRFSAAISNASGAGGIALQKRIFGETVKDLTTRFPRWFTPGFARYADDEAALPVDAHELAALIAPRPLLVTSGSEDLWSDPHGEFLSLVAVDPVYRLLTNEGIETKEWPGAGRLIDDRLGYFVRKGPHDVTLADWRAMLAFVPRHTGSPHLPVHAVERYASRLAALPAADQEKWHGWFSRSEDWRRKQDAALDAEVKAAGLVKPNKPPHGAVFKTPEKKPKAFFASAEMKTLAAAVISYQLPSGGWSKAVGYEAGPRPKGTQWVHQDDPWHYAGTIDNRSTTEQVHFLALVNEAAPSAEVRDAALRGLGYLVEAQFPSGGWPQCYPLEGGYHDALTLNDEAMTNVLEVLRLASAGESGFGWLDQAQRVKAKAAFDLGLETLLRLQVRRGGKLTVWAAQYDLFTHEPVSARGFEPAALSGGSESIETVRYLMKIPLPSREVRESIEGALAWFEANKLAPGDDGKPRWSRFYDLNTGVAFYPGKTDGRCWSDYEQMRKANPGGYDFFTTKPNDLTGKWAERWRKDLSKKRK